MKKSFWAFSAIILAIGFSAYTSKKNENKKPDASNYLLSKYYEYSTTASNQKDFSNYTEMTPQPTEGCPEDNKLCFILVTDVSRPGGGLPNGVIDAADFDIAFEAIDGDFNGSDNNSLDDEDEGDETLFSKREN